MWIHTVDYLGARIRASLLFALPWICSNAFAAWKKDAEYNDKLWTRGAVLGLACRDNTGHFCFNEWQLLARVSTPSRVASAPAKHPATSVRQGNDTANPMSWLLNRHRAFNAAVGKTIPETRVSRDKSPSGFFPKPVYSFPTWKTFFCGCSRGRWSAGKKG